MNPNHPNISNKSNGLRPRFNILNPTVQYPELLNISEAYSLIEPAVGNYYSV